MTTSVNITIYSGYLGKDPKFFEATPKMKNGKISIDVAIDESYQKQDGEGNWVTIPKTTWVRGSSFDKRIIGMAKRLKKGEFVQVEAKLGNFTKTVDNKNFTELQVEMTALKPHNAKKGASARDEAADEGLGEPDADLPQGGPAHAEDENLALDANGL